MKHTILPTLAFIVLAFCQSATALERISLDNEGNQLGAASDFPSVSGDGRFVAFTTEAAISPLDTNGLSDVYVLDRVEKKSVLVSANPVGAAGNNYSYEPSISDDGTAVCFASYATDLVATVITDYSIFHRDLATGTTTLVSVNDSGTQAKGFRPDLTGDGSIVVFHAFNSGLVAGPGMLQEVFLVTVGDPSSLVRVSEDSMGNPYGDSWKARITPDGRYVLFACDGDGLITGGAQEDLIFRKDMQTGETILVSKTSTGAYFNDYCDNASISDDGRFISYDTDADNFELEPSNGDYKVYLYDVVADTTEIVSRNSSGAEADGNSETTHSGISGDGNFIAFSSYGTNLMTLPDGSPSDGDVFLRNRTTGTTTVLSVNLAGNATGNEHSRGVAISSDGKHVIFGSYATDLVPGDTNGQRDLFAWPGPDPVVATANNAPDKSALLKKIKKLKKKLKVAKRKKQVAKVKRFKKKIKKLTRQLRRR